MGALGALWNLAIPADIGWAELEKLCLPYNDDLDSLLTYRPYQHSPWLHRLDLPVEADTKNHLEIRSLVMDCQACKHQTLAVELKTRILLHPPSSSKLLGLLKAHQRACTPRMSFGTLPILINSLIGSLITLQIVEFYSATRMQAISPPYLLRGH